jgi:hypothetical protein
MVLPFSCIPHPYQKLMPHEWAPVDPVVEVAV